MPGSVRIPFGLASSFPYSSYWAVTKGFLLSCPFLVFGHLPPFLSLSVMIELLGGEVCSQWWSGTNRKQYDERPSFSPGLLASRIPVYSICCIRVKLMMLLNRLSLPWRMSYKRQDFLFPLEKHKVLKETQEWYSHPEPSGAFWTNSLSCPLACSEPSDVIQPIPCLTCSLSLPCNAFIELWLTTEQDKPK